MGKCSVDEEMYEEYKRLENGFKTAHNQVLSQKKFLILFMALHLIMSAMAFAAAISFDNDCAGTVLSCSVLFMLILSVYINYKVLRAKDNLAVLMVRWCAINVGTVMWNFELMLLYGISDELRIGIIFFIIQIILCIVVGTIRRKNRYNVTEKRSPFREIIIWELSAIPFIPFIRVGRKFVFASLGLTVQKIFFMYALTWVSLVLTYTVFELCLYFCKLRRTFKCKL